MGKRFQRHRPFDCLRFLYPQILHSKLFRSPCCACPLQAGIARTRYAIASSSCLRGENRIRQPLRRTCAHPSPERGTDGRRLMQPEYSVASRNSIRRRWNHNKRPFTSGQGPGGNLFHNLLTNCARLAKKMWIGKPQAIRRAEPLCFWRPAQTEKPDLPYRPGFRRPRRCDRCLAIHKTGKNGGCERGLQRMR